MAKQEKLVVEISFATLFLGVWLLAAPLTFGYANTPSCISDWISGALLIFFGWISTRKEHHWAAAGAALVGLWLQFSPLIFWASAPAAYLNATAIGILAIIFGLAHPGMTGLHRPSGAAIPPGWSFNPSTWSLRLPTIGLATLAWFFARYMAAYQLGYIESVWDPLFGNGTQEVITSRISQLFPVSDAGLGALGYTLEALLGWQGDTKRWHTMPWMVLAFGFLVIPAGLISIILIILQPVAVGAWCFLCLATAACMLLMILFTLSEVVATLQFLARMKREGKSFWHTVWFGDVIAPEKRSRSAHAKRLAWGITFPWNLLLSAALGIWLMLDPRFLGTLPPASDLAYIIGPLVIVLSIVACAEAARTIRYINVLFGLILIVVPWFLSGAAPLSFWTYIAVGVVLILLSFRKGKVIEHYGEWDKKIC